MVTGCKSAGVLFILFLTAAATQAQSYKVQVAGAHRGPAAVGQSARVAMVEAPEKSADGRYSPRSYAPHIGDPEFGDTKVYFDKRARHSAHSNTVARLFFGKRRSIAHGIREAWVFPMGTWTTRLANWSLDADQIDGLFPARIINHSWVATASPARNARILKRLDYSAISNNVLHVYGVRRRGAGEPLLAGAFNGIAVGGAAMNITEAWPGVEPPYAGARFRPEIVAPFAYSSAAVAVVSAAAVRLNALATAANITVVAPPRAGATTLPVELVKALLLAGASADFTFRDKKDILKYTFGRAGIAANGLDKRYGMGMLNVAASEQMMTSEDPMTGFTYVPRSDNAATGSTGRVSLSPPHDGRLVVSLVWLVQLDRTTSGELKGRLANYDLCVVETVEEDTVIAESVGTDDATENLRVDLRGGHHYEIRVLSVAGDNDSWPYALAWRYQHSR